MPRGRPANFEMDDFDYSRVNVEDFLSSLGVEIAYVSHGNAGFKCPFHNDHTPSARMSVETTAWLCLRGGTKVITDQGSREISSLVGRTHNVLTTGGVWTNAPFSSFGEANLDRVVISRNGIEKEIFCTSDHRWFVKAGRTRKSKREVLASNLKNGDRLVSLYPKMSPVTCNPSMGISPFGISRGIVFGDGSRHGKGSVAHLYGDKDAELLKWFPLSKRSDKKLNSTYSDGMSAVRIFDLPAYFKDELPNLNENPSYLYGWLAGYFAADGSIMENGTICIGSANHDHLEYVRSICNRIGVGTFGVRKYTRSSGFVTDNKFFYYVSLSPFDLTPDFFLLSSHRDRFESMDPSFARNGWIVKSVEKTNLVEEVFCATVPNTHAFALEDNILTGNCNGCGEKGKNAISFLAKMKSFTMSQAKRIIEERYGGALTAPLDDLEAEVRRNLDRSDPEPEVRVKPDPTWEMDFCLAAYAPESWPDGVPSGVLGSVEYMRSRGFSRDTLNKWGIGYDWFSDRVTIPVRDENGELIGFKGRAWKDGHYPKYLVLGDAPGRSVRYGFQTHRKSEYVFGLDRCDQQPSLLIIVEGELNVLAMDQHGYSNVVAAAGAEFSTRQAELIIERAQGEVIVFFDDNSENVRRAEEEGRVGVDAGRMGSSKVVAALQPHMRVRVVLDAPGDANELDRSTIDDLLDSAKPAVELQVRGLLTSIA